MRRRSTDNLIEIAAVLVILLASLGLRWRYMALNPMLDRDSSLYCQIAAAWSQTGDFEQASENFGGTAPLYIHMLKIGVDLGIPIIGWGRFLAFFFSGVFVLAFYFLGKQLFPGRRDGALICMLLAGVHPIIGRLSVGLLREGPFLALTALAMIAFVRAFKTRSIKAALSCGVLLGAAALTRHESVELLLLGTAALLPWRWKPDADVPPDAAPRAAEDAEPGSKVKAFFRRLLPSLSMLTGACVSAVAILLAMGVPLSFLMNQYWSKLDKIKLQ